MTLDPDGTTPGWGGAASEAPAPNKFLVCAVAFLRAQQLAQGAKPRVENDRHKPAHLAVLEVLADTISWSAQEPAGP